MSAMAMPVTSPALERLRVLFESRRAPSPAVAALERAALERFIALGLPTSRDEPWKYTNLRRLESRSLILPESLAAVDPEVSAVPMPGNEWHRLVFTNGLYSPALSSPAVQGSGVRMRSLEGVLRDSPEEAEDILGAGEASSSARFELLNRAFTVDGVVIDIDPEVVVDRPIYLVFQATGAGRPCMISPRVVIRAGRNARATVIEHYVSGVRAEHFVNAVTRVTGEDGSCIEHYRLQQEGTQVVHLGHLQADVAGNARFVSHTLAWGSSLGRLDLAVRLSGPAASTELNGVFLADGAQHLDTHTCIEHLAPRTESSEDYRGLADGKGRGVFNGKVVVHPAAQKTNARQSNRNLLLSGTAEIDTRPELEINANDVKCSHGATTGQLDPVALFYLRSRGIATEDARAMLALAFVETVVARMGLVPVREHVQRLFRQHFLKVQDTVS